MRTRLAALKRLKELYGTVEEAHSAELQRAAAAVREANQAVGLQQNRLRSARAEGRDALETGDRVGWTAAEVMCEVAGTNRRRLEAIRLEREELSDVARKQYAASRLKSEQMKGLFGRVSEQVETEEVRRMQAMLDDRFLARRSWISNRVKPRANKPMKVS